MATRLRLIDGVDLVVDAPLDQVQKAYEAALANGGALQINVGKESFVVNAQQVLYLQAVENGDKPLNGSGHVASEEAAREPVAD